MISSYSIREGELDCEHPHGKHLYIPDAGYRYAEKSHRGREGFELDTPIERYRDQCSKRLIPQAPWTLRIVVHEANSVR